MVFFKFSNFFAIFLEFSISCRVGTKTERYLLYSLFLGLYQPILAWNEAIIVFFNFLNFFAIFLEFSISRRVGTERNGMTVAFSAFSNLFWLEMKPERYILIFWILLLFFWNFKLRLGWERNVTIIFIFSLSRHFPINFGLKWCHNGILNVFAIFLEFSITSRVGTERNDNFYFLFFSAFFNLFWLERMP